MSSDETAEANTMGEAGSPVLKTKVRGRERSGMGQAKAPVRLWGDRENILLISLLG